MRHELNSSNIHFGNRYAPFSLTDGRPDAIRALSSPEGVADRLRVVAMAELQARDLFLYGAERFAGDAPESWLSAWKAFALVEDRHAQMLLDRMAELGVVPGERTVSDKLSRLCRLADDHVTFLFLLSSAEERGMEAGQVLSGHLRPIDELSAAVFARIAAEEVEHVEHARHALAAFPAEPLRARARGLGAMV